MSSKKKLVISLSVAAAVLVAAIIAIVAVFAAANQAVQSSITVKFRAQDVSCTVAGTWKVSGEGGANGSLGSLTIAAKNIKDTYEMIPTETELPLTSTNNSVDFDYTFTNNGSRDFTIKLNSISYDETNMDIAYLLNGTEVDKTIFDGTDDESTIKCSAKVAADTVNTQKLTVRLTVKADSYDNDFDFKLQILWDLDALSTPVVE